MYNDPSPHNAMRMQALPCLTEMDCPLIAPMTSGYVIVLANGSQTSAPVSMKTSRMEVKSRIISFNCRKGFLQFSSVISMKGHVTLFNKKQSSFEVLFKLETCDSKRGLYFSGCYPDRFASTASFAVFFRNPDIIELAHF